MANKSVINLYNCHRCKVWMKREETTILQHFNECHQDEGQGRSLCPICLKPFARKWTVHHHIQQVHDRLFRGELRLPTLVKKPQIMKKSRKPLLWPAPFRPSAVTIRILYANNSPYPSNLQMSTSHPPRTVSLL